MAWEKFVAPTKDEVLEALRRHYGTRLMDVNVVDVERLKPVEGMRPKNFHGRAHVINCDCGTKFLCSYRTIVARVWPDGLTMWVNTGGDEALVFSNSTINQLEHFKGRHWKGMPIDTRRADLRKLVNDRDGYLFANGGYPV